MEFFIVPAFATDQLLGANRFGATSEYFEEWMIVWHLGVLVPSFCSDVNLRPVRRISP
jgi:hypothetical protein